MTDVLWLAVAAVLVGTLIVALHPRRSGGARLSLEQRHAYRVLRTANVASPLLRSGLTVEGAERAVGPLRDLLATRGVVLAGAGGVIASSGVDADHCAALTPTIDAVIASGRAAEVPAEDLRCDSGRNCPLTGAVAAPLHAQDGVAGVLVAVDSRASAGLFRLCVEVADFVSGRLGPAGADPDAHGESSLEMVPVGTAGRTMILSRTEVAWVESAGDYVRLHTFDDRSFLVRLSMARLEEAWGAEGFARIHRRYLVCLPAVHELRCDGAQMWVELPGAELPVSRRHTRQLKDRLVRHTVPNR